jgi:DNA polymerase III delta prime subunit
MSARNTGARFSAAGLPWIEKYRPTRLSDVVSHGDIVATIRRMMERGELPHLLLYGPPGTGKTSTILAVAREVDGAEVLELNASDERGIDVVRDRIKAFVATQQLRLNPARSLTTAAPHPTAATQTPPAAAQTTPVAPPNPTTIAHAAPLNPTAAPTTGGSSSSSSSVSICLAGDGLNTGSVPIIRTSDGQSVCSQFASTRPQVSLASASACSSSVSVGLNGACSDSAFKGPESRTLPLLASASTNSICSAASDPGSACAIGLAKSEAGGVNARKPALRFGLKLVVLDEADSMTQPAQMALRRIFEIYSRQARFCLIANYVHRIIPALQSRCTRFRFAPLPDRSVAERLKYVAKCERLKIDGRGLAALLRVSNGDLRKALNVLQACRLSAPPPYQTPTPPSASISVAKSAATATFPIENTRQTAIADSFTVRHATAATNSSTSADSKLGNCVGTIQPLRSDAKVDSKAGCSGDCSPEVAALMEVGEDLVYATTGLPSPLELSRTYAVLRTNSFAHGCSSVRRLVRDLGLSLADIVRGLHDMVFAEATSKKLWTNPAFTILVLQLSALEARLAAGTSERTQLQSLVAAFHLAREKNDQTHT